MNLTRLRYFVAVAETGNIIRASQTLRVAQSALSRQLQALEREVGTPLLERHARGVRLTGPGRALLVHAREAVAASEAGIAAARLAADSTAGVRVSVPDWPHRSVLIARATALLRRRMPEVVVVHDASPWTVSPSSLRAGTIDVGFGIVPEPSIYGPEIEGHWLLPEPCSCAIIPERHPLAERDTLRLTDLRELPALVPPRDQVGELHDIMVGTIRMGGYEPTVVPAPLNFSAATQMVVAGAGWILSVLSIGEYVPPGTAVRPVEDASIMCGFFALTRRGDDRPAVRAFVDALRSVTTRDLNMEESASGEIG